MTFRPFLQLHLLNEQKSYYLLAEANRTENECFEIFAVIVNKHTCGINPYDMVYVWNYFVII